MSSSNLIRWGGLAALGGGVLLVILSILEAVLFGRQPDSAAVAKSSWVIVQVAFIVVAMLLILGLIGLYARQVEQSGALGLVAFLVTLTGTVMVAGLEWSAAFFAPWLAEVAPPEVLNAEPTGVALVGFLLTFVLFALGWLLFGLASLQAGVLPRGSAILLMVGALLVIIMLFLEILFEVVVLGLALAWMGYALWSGRREPAKTAEMAI